MRIVAPYVYRVVRPDADLSDLTASVETAPRTTESDPVNALVITFNIEPTPEEQDNIIIRLITTSTIEENLVRRARLAIGLNADWRAITNPTAAEAFMYLDRVSLELDALIRVVMRWLDSE